MVAVQLPVSSGDAYFDFGSGDGSQVNPYTPSPVAIATLPALPAGSNTIGAISNSSFAATQSGSWMVTANAGTGTFASNISQVGGSNFNLGQQLAADSVPVVLTAAQLSTLTPLSTITANLGTIGSAATETTLSSLNTKIPSNLTVTSTRLLVDGSGVTQPVSGTVTANLGTIGSAATAANQTTGNTSLSSIDSKTPALGQALAAASVPVVLTAAQITTLTPPTTVTVTQSTAANLLTTATLNTRHEAAITPLANRLSDGSAFISSTNPLAINPYDLAGTTGSITAVDSATTSTAAADGQFAITGAPTTSSSTSLAISGKSTVTIQVSGTFVGTLRFERSADGGTTWYAVGAVNTYNLAVTSTTTTIGSFQVNVSGFTNLRVRCTAYTSGTANIAFQSGVGLGLHSTRIARQRLTFASATISTSGDNTIIAAPGATSRIIYTKIRVQNKSGSPTNIIIKNGSTQIDEIVTSATTDGIAEVYPNGFQPALDLNAALVFNLSAANSTSYTVWYYLE